MQARRLDRQFSCAGFRTGSMHAISRAFNQCYSSYNASLRASGSDKACGHDRAAQREHRYMLCACSAGRIASQKAATALRIERGWAAVLLAVLHTSVPAGVARTQVGAVGRRRKHLLQAAGHAQRELQRLKQLVTERHCGTPARRRCGRAGSAAGRAQPRAACGAALLGPRLPGRGRLQPGARAGLQLCVCSCKTVVCRHAEAPEAMCAQERGDERGGEQPPPRGAAGADMPQGQVAGRMRSPPCGTAGKISNCASEQAAFAESVRPGAPLGA